MMRLILGLMWTLVLFAYLSAEAGRGESALSLPSTPCWPTRIEGLGTDLDKAKANALKETRKQIIDCLRRQKPPLTSWVPSRAYIREHLIKKQERGEDVQALEEGRLTAKRWIVYLKTPNWEQLYRLDQEVERSRRGQERILLLGRVLVDVLVLLAGVVVFARLDYLTRGAYRRWLQVGGAGLIAAAWAGLWLLV